jgi:hypothetical protein
MAAVSEEEQRAARTKVVGALGVFGLVLIAVIVGLIWAGHQTSSGGPAASAGNGGTAPAAADGQAQAGGWDVAGETALAAAPMRQFPDSAAMPQTIATTSLPVMNVPAATRANPAGVGEGFPATPEGAIGQLAAMETDALADLSPQTFGAAYASISAPGAPAPESTPLGTQVASVTEQLGGSGPPITSRWQLAGAQVKGVTDGGRAVVVCVAGDLQIAQANTGEAGTGDCQAMRWNGNDWRIAPVPAPAQAPITWPGSAAFTQAGYHPTNGGPSS